jgi:hypothetical protein
MSKTATAAATTEAGADGASASVDGDKGAVTTKDPGIQPSHDESTAKDKGEEKPKVAARPEWAPENYWDADKGELKAEDLAKGYGDLRKKVTMRTDDLEKKVKEDFEKSRFVNRPESADKYELRLPESVPADAWEWNEKDPLLGFARELAFNTGMSQDEFDKLVGTYVQSEISKLPDIESETKRLGEKGKERLERVDNWMSANMTRGAYAALSNVATKAEVVIAIEELMQKAGAPAFAIADNELGGQEVLNDALVRSWMADPKYWDPAKREPKFVEKVDKAWQKMYPPKKK